MADVSTRSSPLRDVLQGGMSATQRQKFHTKDVKQCLHNKSGSHGVPNANLFNFTFLLVDFGKVLCSTANELQKNSNASSGEVIVIVITLFNEGKDLDYGHPVVFIMALHYSTNIDCFVRGSSCFHLTFTAFCLLSVIANNS